MTELDLRFKQQLGIQVPIICGPMYPCSNPELVAAVSAAGGIGIVQPISLTYVHGYDFREGLKAIRRMTDQPIGLNALIEKSSKRYYEKMIKWVDIALEEGVLFFITSLGKPDWVVERVHAAGGFVYHDVTERKWAMKAVDADVDGLIAVNNRAGGHAGTESVVALYESLADLGLPIICAGGIADAKAVSEVLQLGYAGVQMGTRFIATTECKVPENYKQAIVLANEKDIVLTENITGIPVSVINTPYIHQLGLKPGKITQWMLNHPKFKYLVRMAYFLRSMRKLKTAVLDQRGQQEFWQAGKSVGQVHDVRSVAEVMRLLSQDLN